MDTQLCTLLDTDSSKALTSPSFGLFICHLE